MNKPNRDLLVLFNEEVMTPKAIEFEVELLHNLLCNVERLDNIIIAHELIDINKYKIINKQLALRTFFKQYNHKPFVFLNCKN
jgi:hypothetical protein